jgi:putative transposase
MAHFLIQKSQVSDVVRYIQNQEAHHQKETFLNEYKRFLKAFEIEWDEKYTFKELE